MLSGIRGTTYENCVIMIIYTTYSYALLASIIYEMLRKFLLSRLEDTVYHVAEQCVNNIIRKYSGKLN